MKRESANLGKVQLETDSIHERSSKLLAEAEEKKKLEDEEEKRHKAYLDEHFEENLKKFQHINVIGKMFTE